MIVDAHNDLLLELVLRRDEANPFARHWLPKLRAGGIALQVCPAYAADRPAEAHDVVAAQVRAFEDAVGDNDGDVLHVTDAETLQQTVANSDCVGLMLSMEGAEALGDDPDAFAPLYDRGVRMVSLTWNYPNGFAGGIDAPELGLTDHGRALVDELVARRVVIDLAHASEKTYFEVLERAPDAQVVVSHANCRAVFDHRRNLSDDQLRALADHGGVLGMMGLSLVVGPRPASIDDWLAHFDHAVETMGIDHVGLGADVIDQVIQCELAHRVPQEPMTLEALAAGGGILGLRGFTGPEDYPRLMDALRRRGYTGAALDAILHANFLRVLRAALVA